MSQQFSVSIEGAKQGPFKSESQTREDRQAAIRGIKFLLESVSPRDVATGQASGKRQHKPVSFTKEWGAASPQLLTALATNEVLKQVVFEFTKPSGDGRETVFHKVTLTNASVASIRSYVDQTDTSGDPFDGHALEDVTLTYQSLAMESLEGKTASKDDWIVH